jgi:hypothetical protein
MREIGFGIADGLAAALAAALVAACSSTSQSSTPSDSGAGDAVAISDASRDDARVSDASSEAGGPSEGGFAPADGGVKTPISGLIDMQDISWHDAAGGEPAFTMDNVNLYPGLFGGIVLNATWDTIQSSQTAALDFSAIDDALAQIRAYNGRYPAAPLGVKLRVYQGANAPAWAKAIGGGPVSIMRNPGGCAVGPCPLTVGKYWTTEYIAAWRTFQADLAARYDGEPLIAQVAVTSCASQTDEPFVPTTDAASIAALAAAGYTDDAEQACLRGALDDYAPWKSTLIDYTFNSFGVTVPGDAGLGDAGTTDATFASSVMQQCRNRYGDRCVLDNHALGVPVRKADQPVYDEMVMLGGPIDFHTNAPKVYGCLWIETVAQAVAYGARALEVWPAAKFDGFDSLTVANIQQLDGEFVHPVPVPAQLPTTTCPTFN